MVQSASGYSTVFVNYLTEKIHLSCYYIIVLTICVCNFALYPSQQIWLRMEPNENNPTLTIKWFTGTYLQILNPVVAVTIQRRKTLGISSICHLLIAISDAWGGSHGMQMQITELS